LYTYELSGVWRANPTGQFSVRIDPSARLKNRTQRRPQFGRSEIRLLFSSCWTDCKHSDCTVRRNACDNRQPSPPSLRCRAQPLALCPTIIEARHRSASSCFARAVLSFNNHSAIRRTRSSLTLALLTSFLLSLRPHATRLCSQYAASGRRRCRVARATGTQTFRETFAADNSDEDMNAYVASSFSPVLQASELAILPHDLPL